MIWLTRQIPGTGGHYKETPEDFQVEEIPLYPCSGEGEHLYLWIEKSGISTRKLVQQLIRQLALKEHQIGYAGLKDSRALTRQMISIPAGSEKKLSDLRLRQARIIRSQRHGNKLRLGHLAGNRFRIRLTDTHADALERARATLDQLCREGVPNLFGEQRYGVLGNSAQLGMSLLTDEYQQFCQQLLGDPELIRDPGWKAAATFYRAGKLEEALRTLPHQMRDEQRLLNQLLRGLSCRDAVLSLSRNLLRLFLSAAQAELFDQLLQLRLPELGRLLDGDIAMKHANGACFLVASAMEEQQRADVFEISPTAPLFGTKVLTAEGIPGRQEKQLLANAGLSLECWNAGQGLTMPGERRVLRVPLTETSVKKYDNSSIILNFTLPKGSYATSVLREIIK